jgi:hypothetical protein
MGILTEVYETWFVVKFMSEMIDTVMARLCSILRAIFVSRGIGSHA